MSQSTISTHPEQQLANVLPDAIMILDKSGEIQWYNLAAKKLFAIKGEQKINMKQLFNDPDFKLPLLKGSSNAIELKLPHNPKTRISVSFLSYQHDQHLLLARDVTHVYHLEKMRQDFLANVSHELRTPLTVVHGYLETLLDQDIDETKPYKKIFTHMYDQSRRMESLVNDLLLLSRLEAELPEDRKYQKVFVAPMLHAICHEAEALSGERNHKFHLCIDNNLQIHGFEDELRSAFSNIIYNAVKYTPAEGQIYVNWELQNDYPCLAVRDTGIGIEAKHIPRLTERFYRVDRARSRSSGGTGLGLAIVKHVLIRHRAYMKITSKFEKGSTFSCIFPKKNT